jgi:hypothetical protein
MRKMLVLALVLGLVGVAAAHDFGTQAPVKTPQTFPQNVPNPVRQGGDTIGSAMVIPGIPYNDDGMTSGYNDDYDEVCPYTDSTSPDVVYQYTAGSTVYVDIDLCGSGYDTKLYVYDAALSLVACNDDFHFAAPCFVYSSKLENIEFSAGNTYYIIVDGWNGDSGDYVLDISEAAGPCVLECPAEGMAEGEPALVPNYIDNYNGGCNTIPGNPFQDIQTAPGMTTYTLCGVSGWYSADGLASRDTDWFLLHMGVEGAIEVTLDAEQTTYMFELTQDCNNIALVQQATAGPCLEASFSISGYDPGMIVWFWVGPTTFEAPPGADSSYDYVVRLSGLDGTIATESTTWGSMKALFE